MAHVTQTEQRLLLSLPASDSPDREIIIGLEQKCLLFRQDGLYQHFSQGWQRFVEEAGMTGSLRTGPLAIDQHARRVTLNGDALHVTPSQFALLYLAEHSGRSLTTGNWKRRCGGSKSSTTRSG